MYANAKYLLSSNGSLLIHLPISGLYFRIWYSLNPVTGQYGLVLNWCVKVEASEPEATSGSPKGE